MELQQIKNWIKYNDIVDSDKIIFSIDAIDKHYKGIIWELPVVDLGNQLFNIQFSINERIFQIHFFYDYNFERIDETITIHEMNLGCESMPSTLICVYYMDNLDYACYMINKTIFGIIKD